MDLKRNWGWQDTPCPTLIITLCHNVCITKGFSVTYILYTKTVAALFSVLVRTMQEVLPALSGDGYRSRIETLASHKPIVSIARISAVTVIALCEASTIARPN